MIIIITIDLKATATMGLVIEHAVNLARVFR
jgi:hypothetical protein